jgi:hypothetical protein
VKEVWHALIKENDAPAPGRASFSFSGVGEDGGGACPYKSGGEDTTHE